MAGDLKGGRKGLKAAGFQDKAREEAEVYKIIGADQADNGDELPVIQEGYLPFHFKDRFFDGHNGLFKMDE